MREPDGVGLGCDALLQFDAHLYLHCSQRTPVITPPVLGRVIGVEGELINHRALGVRYRVRPPHVSIEAQAHAGGTDQADAVSVVDAGNGEVLLPETGDAVPGVMWIGEQQTIGALSAPITQRPGVGAHITQRQIR